MQRTGGEQLDATGRETARRGGKGKTREGKMRRDGCICTSRARYRDKFHSPDRFRREDETRTVLEPGASAASRIRQSYDRWNPESVNPTDSISRM